MDSGKIIIKGARENNLKNINLEIPRNKLIVMTGVSGSGKSSLFNFILYIWLYSLSFLSLMTTASQFISSLSLYKFSYLEFWNNVIEFEIIEKIVIQIIILKFIINLRYLKNLFGFKIENFFFKFFFFCLIIIYIANISI